MIFMKIVYLLQHVAREDASDEDIKTIGIYSSKEKAQGDSTDPLLQIV